MQQYHINKQLVVQMVTLAVHVYIICTRIHYLDTHTLSGHVCTVVQFSVLWRRKSQKRREDNTTTVPVELLSRWDQRWRDSILSSV